MLPSQHSEPVCNSLIRKIFTYNYSLVVDNGWIPKLFSSLNVEIESQTVSTNRVKGEYFLKDFLMCHINFNVQYIESPMQLHGYYDPYNVGTPELNTKNENQEVVLTTDAENVISRREYMSVRLGIQLYFNRCPHEIHNP